MPKTGSVSMKAAYEILGLPAYHGFVWIKRPNDKTMFEKAVNAKYYHKGTPFGRQEFDAMLG